MDNDGHTGIDNQQLKHGASGNFNLILSGLKHGNGRFDFVIHVSPNVSYDVGIKPDKFLEDIGFLHYAGQCPFYQERCFYRIISTVTPNSLLYRDMIIFIRCRVSLYLLQKR